MTKTILILLLTAIPVFTVMGQDHSATKQQTVYDFAEEPPQFPGGLEAWRQYLQRNLQYPESAKKASVEERVFVSFIVTQQGKITDVEAKKHPNKVYHPDLIKEAERLIQNMPDWVPGKVGGQVVTCRFNMPIAFSLN